MALDPTESESLRLRNLAVFGVSKLLGVVPSVNDRLLSIVLSCVAKILGIVDFLE